MAYPSTQPIAKTAAYSLTRAVDAGNVVIMNSATGFIITLPASAGTGDIYEVFVGTTVSSGSHVIKVANSTDVLAGAVHLTTDISGTSMPASGTDDTITMNGTTTGGVRGSWLRFKDVTTGFWALEGGIVCTGAESTPFSATV